MTRGWKVGYRMRDVTTARCARCDQELPIASFRVLRHGSHASYCTPCQVRLTREWRAANRDENNARRRQAYRKAQSAAGRAPRVVGGGHRGPVDRGLPPPLADPRNDTYTHNDGTR